MAQSTSGVPSLAAHCAYCQAPLVIERLQCTGCKSVVEGKLPIPALARLTREQQRFVEAFLLSNGSLKQIAEEMECSYPKVRSILDGVMEALREIRGKARSQREEILSQLEAGKIKGREAADRVRSLL